MSLRKTRYVHFNHGHHPFYPFNGFTAKISPSTEAGMVQFSVSFCSKKDQFWKFEGRAQAEHAPIFVIPVAHLPARLAECLQTVRGGKWNKFDSKTKRYCANEWAWIWKYFL